MNKALSSEVRFKLRLVQQFLVVLICLFPSVMKAQEPHFRHYNASNGLRGSFLFRIFEDENGKLFLMTNKGPYTYNGAAFKPVGKSDTLTGDIFFHYQKDTIEDSYWFLSTNDQLFKYKQGKLTRECPTQRFCWMDIEPRTGKKWLMDRNGRIFSLVNGKTSLFAAWQSVRPKPVFSRMKDFAVAFLSLGNGRFILGTELGFYYLSKQEQTTLSNISFSGRAGGYPRIFHRLNGEVLIASENGLYGFDRRSHKIALLFTFLQSEIISIYEDKDLWLGTSKGIYRFSEGIISSDRATRFLDSYVINCIFKDATGIFWFGTGNNGMLSCDFRASHYKWQENVSEKSISFLKKEGNLMYAFSLNGDAFYLENGKMVKVQKRQKGFGISDNIRYVYSIQEGGICIMSGFLYAVIKNKKEISYSISPYAEVNGRYYYYTPDLGIEWRSAKGIKKILNNRQRISLIKKYPSTLGVGQVYFDAQGSLYYSNKADRSVLKVTASGDTVKCANIAVNSRVWEMSGIYNDNIILIPTEGNGVALYSKNRLSWITEKDGLLSNFCKRIKTDSQYVWISTDVGLSRLSIDPDGRLYTVANFTTDNVLLSNDVNDVEIMGDTVYVASFRGVSRFWRHLSVNPVNYHCYLEKLEVNTRDTTVMSGYNLAYGQNNLTITLGQSSRQLYDNMSYKYMLSEGSGDTQVVRSNILNLVSIQPGSYHLQVWSRNINGMWSAKPAQLDFTIDPPFWKTLWFKLIIVGILAFVALSILYTYQRRQRKKAEVARMLVESDLRSLRLHMNPHFIFNSLTSLQSFIVTKKNEEAEEYISSFSNMIRSVMSYSVVGEITLAEEVAFLKQYIELELIRFDNQFDYTVTVSEDIQPDSVVIPSLLIQPLVENAIKHGLTGLNHKAALKVHFEMDNGKLHCTVEDNGRGRTEASAAFNKVSGHISTGIRFTEERIRLLIKDDTIQPITITDLMDKNRPAGTRVTMVVPILE